MNNRYVALAGLLAGIASAASPTSEAQTGFQPSPGLANVRLDLDTQDGHASSMTITATCGLNAARVKLKLARLGSDPQWLPAATIILSSGQNSVALQFGGSRTSPLRGMIFTRTNGQEIRAPLKSSIALNGVMDIAVDWTPKGDITFRIGEETQSAALGVGVGQIQFANSTSEVIFGPLSVGRTSAPAAECPIG